MSNKPQESARGPNPFRVSIVPDGVYVGDGVIFASENLFSSAPVKRLRRSPGMLDESSIRLR